MATINLGRVGFVPRGEYSESAQYVKYDLVSYKSSVYCVLASSVTGVTPSDDGTNYLLFVNNSDAIAAAEAANEAATAANTAAKSYEGVIGTETLKTTAQTLKGGINEVKEACDTNTRALDDLGMKVVDGVLCYVFDDGNE